MTLEQWLELLDQYPERSVQFQLPNGEMVPAHFHVTEVARVQKDFIDCGGTIRSQAACVLQVWVADDTQHRLDSSKLAKIVRMGLPLFATTDVPVEIEYDDGRISQYSVRNLSAHPASLCIELGTKHTDCLAPDRCGVAPQGNACCTTPGCC